MPTSFTNLMASALKSADSGRARVELDVPDDWMQGRSVFGGLQAAVALRAMRGVLPGVPLRTLQMTFLAPAAGRLRADAEILRSGKSATHVQARLVDGAATLATAIGVFGLPRPSNARVVPAQPPSLRVHSIDLPFIPGIVPNFTQHFGAKWLRGMPPFTGDPSTEHELECWMHDDGPMTEEHVIAIADFIPPLALTHLAAPAPGSTVAWMLELLVDDVTSYPMRGWRLDAELVSARDGYTSQSVMIWSPTGDLVAVSRQSMLVFG